MCSFLQNTLFFLYVTQSLGVVSLIAQRVTYNFCESEIRLKFWRESEVTCTSFSWEILSVYFTLRKMK